MKKFKIIIGIVIIGIVTTIFLSQNVYAAGIKRDITERESNKSVVTFKAKKGEVLKISYSSSIEEGSLILQLVDKNKVITYINTNEEGKLEINVEDNNEYELLANHNDFRGKYNIKIYK